MPLQRPDDVFHRAGDERELARLQSDRTGIRSVKLPAALSDRVGSRLVLSGSGSRSRL